MADYYSELKEESKILDSNTIKNETNEEVLRAILNEIDIDTSRDLLTEAKQNWKTHLFSLPSYYPRASPQGRFKTDIEKAEARFEIVKEELELILSLLNQARRDREKAERDAVSGTSNTTRYNELSGKGDPLTEYAGRPVGQNTVGEDRFLNGPRELVSEWIKKIKAKRREELRTEK